MRGWNVGIPRVDDHGYAGRMKGTSSEVWTTRGSGRRKRLADDMREIDAAFFEDFALFEYARPAASAYAMLGGLRAVFFAFPFIGREGGTVRFFRLERRAETVLEIEQIGFYGFQLFEVHRQQGVAVFDVRASKNAKKSFV